MLTKIIILFSLSVSLCINSLEVKTSSGIVRGKTIEILNKNVNQFLNIPYAEPPVESLRFSKPLPLKEPIKTIIDGTKPGNSCFQHKKDETLVQSEDCLVLNVWSPTEQSSSVLRPVMFWIYGGGLIGGSIFMPAYNGSALSSHDVVFVSANYRLGSFGWLFGGDESAPGNIGLYDQLLALKWVKQNIRSFGGDPNLITIFGQSAGGQSVAAHILSPLSRGLFKRAIIQSGAVFDNKNSPILTKTSALNQAKKMAKHFNCSDDSQWLNCLRKIDAKELNSYSKIQSYLIHDTEVLPFLAQRAFKLQKYSSEIDIMTGVMQNEGSLLSHGSHPKSTEEFQHLIQTFYLHELNSTKIAEFYLKNVDTNSTEAIKKAFDDFYGDIVITCPTYFFAKQFAKHSPKRNVFFYEWTYVSKVIASRLGCVESNVCHGSEIAYVFGQPLIMNMTDQRLREDVMKIWTNFAKNGHPLEGLQTGLKWPRLIEAGSQNVTTHIREINPTILNRIIENLFENNCDGFWKNYFIE